MSRVVLITGGTSGIGLSLAESFLAEGASVVVCGRSPDALDRFSRAHPGALAVQADVTVPAARAVLLEAVAERFGRLDVLVTNAGTIQVGPAFAMRAPDFSNAMDLMFYGVLHPVLAALPVMKERGAGRILIISSIGGKLPAPHLLPYVAAKHAAVGFAEGLRVEAIRHGITVTCAVPGLMRTGSPRNALFTGDQAAEHRWFTLGDSLPLVSMDAERAARQLIGAALKGKPEVAPTPLAKIGMRVHGVAPSTTIRLVSLVNRLLPTDETPRPVRPGHAVEKPAKWFDALTALTRRAARRYHQHDDASPDPAPDPTPSTNP